MKYLFFLLSIVFFISCEKQGNEGEVIVDVAISISVKDGDGNDLLNANGSNSLNQHDFKVIYEINGKQVEVNDQKLHSPKGFFVYQAENEYRIRIFPNTDKNVERPVTYIQWSETEIDTIKCEIERKGSSTICTKVWLNDELVWQAYDTERFIQIVK